MSGGTRRATATVAGALLGAAGGVLLLVGTTSPADPPAPAPGVVVRSPVVPLPEPSAGTLSPGEPALPRSVPVQLDIPRIGVRSPLLSLGLNRDGTVEVPPLDAAAPAGWYRYLASPGEPGPAVILGHVDTYRGPAIFYRLGELQADDSVAVVRADGLTVSFRVSSVREYPKAAFPSEAVYGPARDPVVRLVTCGGPFDLVSRSYRDVVVVEARRVPRP
jgi:sortase (surface protein transpeptidase)